MVDNNNNNVFNQKKIRKKRMLSLCVSFDSFCFTICFLIDPSIHPSICPRFLGFLFSNFIIGYWKHYIFFFWFCRKNDRHYHVCWYNMNLVTYKLIACVCVCVCVRYDGWWLWLPKFHILSLNCMCFKLIIWHIYRETRKLWMSKSIYMFIRLFVANDFWISNG